MGKFIDLTGKKFGMLTAVRKFGYDKYWAVIWLCVCECGTETKVTTSGLRSGHTKSCGCGKSRLITETITKHGLYYHPLYAVLLGIKKRCNNRKCEAFKNYGGRGIKICKEWEDVGVFIKWAEENGWEPGLQIDRINNDGNYCPENCRFITCKENVNNKTRPPSTNTTGYTGVSLFKPSNKYKAYIHGTEIVFNRRSQKYLGLFNTPEEAAEARDRFIIENNLPYRKLQILKRP